MYEYTKQAEITKEVKHSSSNISSFKIVAKFIIRVISLFAVYFLLENNFTFTNCVVSLFLIISLLREVLWEK